MGQVDPDRLVFLDESGLDTRLTRPYARAPGGRRAVGRVPGGRWQRLTILGAIARDGLIAVMTAAAATSTAVFLAFLEQVLIPALRARPGALVAMDTLAPHRARRGLGCEPMTAPPNAFATGEGVIRLQPGETSTHVWGVRLGAG